MKLGFVTDSLGAMSFTEMMDHAARMGVSWRRGKHLWLVHRAALQDGRLAREA